MTEEGLYCQLCARCLARPDSDYPSSMLDNYGSPYLLCDFCANDTIRVGITVKGIEHLAGLENIVELGNQRQNEQGG